MHLSLETYDDHYMLYSTKGFCLFCPLQHFLLLLLRFLSTWVTSRNPPWSWVVSDAFPAGFRAATQSRNFFYFPLCRCFALTSKFDMNRIRCGLGLGQFSIGVTERIDGDFNGRSSAGRKFRKPARELDRPRWKKCSALFVRHEWSGSEKRYKLRSEWVVEARISSLPARLLQKTWIYFSSLFRSALLFERKNEQKTQMNLFFARKI